MSATMHAIRQQAFGGPEMLELAELERPVPLPTEALVRVRAVGVNPVEAVIRSGQFPLLGEPPFILGWDVSGVVEDIEPGVTRFQPGRFLLLSYSARTCIAAADGGPRSPAGTPARRGTRETPAV